MIMSTFLRAQQSQWRLADGTKDIAFAALDVYQQNPDTLYAMGMRVVNGTSANGITLRSINNGESWDSIASLGTASGALAIDPVNSKVVFLTGMGADFGSNDIYLTTNSGQTWKGVLAGRGYPTVIIKFDPVKYKIVYVGYDGVITGSSDYGQTWEPIVHSGWAVSMAISPINNNIMYVLGNGGDSLLKSNDHAFTWTGISLKQSITLGTPKSIVIDPLNPNTVYLGVWSSSNKYGGVYKSTDGGETWFTINNGLDSTDRQINILTINPLNTNQIFIGINAPIASHSILFESTDAGRSWFDCSYGLPKAGNLSSIAIDTLNGRLYVGTTSGIYINDSILLNVRKLNSSLTSPVLYQNYPNPFNQSTVIEYSLPIESQVKLEIFDVLGRKILVLVNENQKVGIHYMNFNASNLASGIYFYRLTADNFIETKKLVLLK